MAELQSASHTENLQKRKLSDFDIAVSQDMVERSTPDPKQMLGQKEL